VAGLIRPARRPAGWRAPGPAPAGDQGRPELAPADDEDLCYLSGDWRLFQKRRGHRWSLDDLVTAWIATAGRDPAQPLRALDLGCGLGSVLLMVAWRLPAADVTGVEAQADRAAMGRRAIAYNGAADRCRILDGDLREELVAGPFDLITGTPPYFPRGAGTESAKPHAAPCRFELRGGVEAYLAAARPRLTPDGVLTICTAALERARVDAALAAVGLHRRARWEIIPRDGKPALVDVDVLGLTPATATYPRLTVRDRAGAWTPAFRQLRDDMGMPSQPPA
jgi:tRNA1(Val) A37 N6-methylase TrmN6